MTWIQLANGNGYDFETKEIFGEFDAEIDIAGPLAGENRYVSHTDRPWSVATHSVVVARVILKVTGNKAAAAAGLMHDCHEAVLGDIPTPVAMHIGYDKVKALKNDVHRAIYTRLNLTTLLMPDAVYHDFIEFADRASLHVERQLFMAPEPRSWDVSYPNYGWMKATYDEIREWKYVKSAESAAEAFMDEYRRFVEPLVGK